jgi:phosphonoacetate hydrolase
MSTQSEQSERSIEVNGRAYRLSSSQPVVVVCVDGCEYDYLEAAVAAGVAPFIGKMLQGGRRASRATA